MNGPSSSRSRPRSPARRPATGSLLTGFAFLVLSVAGCSGGTPGAGASPTSTWSVGTPSATGPASTWAAPSWAAPTGAAASDRIRPVPTTGEGRTRVVAPGEGTWIISRPSGAGAGDAEVLHLDDGGRVLRSYPFPGLAPQWLLLAPGAVYCGRGGDDAAPDAMVCRIDRRTGELRVLVAADRTADTAVTEQDVAARPGTWVVDGRNFTADLGTPPRLGSELTFSSGGELRLDPDTLGTLGS